MAAYPSVHQTKGSMVHVHSGVAFIIAGNGSLSERQLFSNPKYELDLLHYGITNTDFLTLKAFWLANYTLPVDVTMEEDGSLYSNCLFFPAEQGGFSWEPIADTLVGAGRLWTVKAKLRKRT